MAPLKGLERNYPLIDSNFQKFCATHGIFTLEDFLVHDIYSLAALAERDYASDKLKQGITQILTILDCQCRPCINGLELLKDAENNKCFLSTGCERIDAILQGGLRGGHVTELVGPSSSGKTQFCLQAASNVARQYSGRVIYFDSGNSFSPKRIAQFLHSSDHSSTKANEVSKKIMSNILHYSIFDIFTLLDMLHQLVTNLKTQMDCQVRMLIVDSLSSLIAPVLGGGGAHGHALMVSAGFLLKELAHEHKLSILVTNHMVAGEAGISKPALGESWKNIPHVRLMLSRRHGTNVSTITLLKHTYLRSTCYGGVTLHQEILDLKLLKESRSRIQFSLFNSISYDKISKTIIRDLIYCC